MSAGCQDVSRRTRLFEGGGDGWGDGWADGKLLTSFCGSRSYCAPEVMAGHGYNGFAADVWSLGTVLYGLAVVGGVRISEGVDRIP